jgi:hypothetical protein
MPKVTNPMPAELAEIIATHRDLFGGFTMMAEDGASTEPVVSGQPNPTPAATAAKVDEQQLGDGGQKALKSERDARKSAEQQVADLRAQVDALKPLQEQMTRLSDAFGAPKGASTEDVVGQLQSQLAELRHDNLVNAIARDHRIVDAADIELLKTASDEASMTKLATRLNPEPGKPGTPKPDLTQGTQGSDNKPDPGPGVARMSAALEEALATP